MSTRIEKDSMGTVEVPATAWYGAHTARSVANFDVGGERMPPEILYAVVKLKWACARANRTLNLLPEDKTAAIEKACLRILTGDLQDQFPVDVYQAGSGTSTNMNVNEVIANLACEELGGQRGDRQRVHPNDDVNKGQSTNNIFPSAIRIAAVELCGGALEEIEHLVAALRAKAEEFAEVIKSGRTHLQDAVPVTLGQEFAAYAHALQKDARRIEGVRERLYEVGVGGNAIGTGVNTPRAFRPLILEELRQIAGAPYRVAENGIEITQFLTDLAEMSAVVRLAAADLHKICNDFRLMASGPNTGFFEILLPAVEPGSSIMPGKINPSICEAANMACLQIMGLDHAVALACAAGQLELNTHMPLIGVNLVKALQLLTRTCRMVTDKCVTGIVAHRDICRKYFETSAGLPTVLNPRLGYDRVAELVKEAQKTGRTLRQLILEKRLMTEVEFDDLLRSSTGPNL